VLIGVEIHLPGQRPRFAGKVTEAPYIDGAPWLKGRRIFYREHPESQLFSTKYDALSVDDAALQEAWALGAEALVCYAPDTRRFYVVDRATCEKAVRVELRAGEGVQARIPRAWALQVEAWQGLHLGYTTRVVPVRPATGPTQTGLFPTR
jgi:hypothetical protein